MSEIKTCTRCKTIKIISEFSKDKTRKDGIHPWCRSCKKLHKSQAIRKYIDFKCTECGDISKHRSDYKKRTTLCTPCAITAIRKPNSLPKIHKRLHYCWGNMKQRCIRPSASGYEKYGGLGITVCKEWSDSFTVFAEWALDNGYEEHLTIDRINGEGNYEPSNCRWATYFTQSANTKLIHKTNTSGYRGVGDFKNGKWTAYIGINHKKIHLGLHEDKLDAVFARDGYIILNNLEHTMNFPSNTVEELQDIIQTYKQKYKDLSYK